MKGRCRSTTHVTVTWSGSLARSQRPTALNVSHPTSISLSHSPALFPASFSLLPTPCSTPTTQAPATVAPAASSLSSPASAVVLVAPLLRAPIFFVVVRGGSMMASDTRTFFPSRSYDDFFKAYSTAMMAARNERDNLVHGGKSESSPHIPRPPWSLGWLV